MRMVDLIQKKRDGKVLSKDEIDYVIHGFTLGEIPDYQMSALLMAIYYRGMNGQEVVDLTLALVNSGDTIDLSPIEGVKVDKHSTGGVGDKVSLILLPLVSYAGVPVAKMAGRGLGHTGGTIDKLESIRDFKTELSREEFINNVNSSKLAIMSQTANLTPADKKLYSLRDVTATVDSIPLIASSVMSKKIASGADAIVLDVKVGTGAFMKTMNEARELARTMVEIGNGAGKKTSAIISNMNQPLGYEIGNANELAEAIKVLRGENIEDLRGISLTLASLMTLEGDAFTSFDGAYEELDRILMSGEALPHLKKLIENQGGNPEVVDNPGLLPSARCHIEVRTQTSGYVKAIDAEQIGVAAMILGAGRRKLNDQIDHSAGITLTKKIGDKVAVGETLCTLHTNLENCDEAVKIAGNAFRLGHCKPEKEEVVLQVIR
ncbi:MAG TPA: pyrimidine-nucleoside phosphorylase [Clostridia bacterium]|nr:pyrimidine-nucleoside phosphorylase [Clostridia bacterium]